MMRTLKRKILLDREKFAVPRSTQDVIPIDRIWSDGIFKSGEYYTRTYRIDDINYATASDADKEAKFLSYSALLNSLDIGATTKITIVNHQYDRKQFADSVLLPMRDDALDKYRTEINTMLTARANESGGIVQDKYISISAPKRDIDTARTYMSRIGAALEGRLSELGSRFRTLDASERLKIFHDFMRQGTKSSFFFDYQNAAKFGINFKDYIAPDLFEFKKSHFVMGDKVGRVLSLRVDASFIGDDFINNLCELNRDMMLSIDIVPMPTSEAIREVDARSMAVEATIANWQRQQNNNNHYNASLPQEFDLQRRETSEMREDVTTRNQRMMFAQVTLVHTADTLEELDADTATLESVAQEKLCELVTLKYQQMEGFKTALPFGVTRISNCWRTMTTESVGVLMPFRVQEVQHPHGVYIGQNLLSRNAITVDREELLNTGGFYLGIPGGGKSMGAKIEVIWRRLDSDDCILLCDPEGEYAALAQQMGGIVIKISAGSKDYINAMDMVAGYSDDMDPVIDKSQFVMSLFERLEKLTSIEKSIIDRCVRNVYKKRKKTAKQPTLCDLRTELLAQPEEEARRLALALELFTSGSLNTFAHETNVDMNNRFIVFDISELGQQLKPLGLLVVTDAMINRVSCNWKNGVRTHVFVDEFHVVYENQQSADFFNSAWRRFRKRGAYPNGITQNVEYLLDSVQASTMLSNSEYIMMFNQSATDRQQLAALLGISNEQLKFITNAQSGNGLARIGSALIPFVNQFPRNTELYKLMTTKPRDRE